MFALRHKIAGMATGVNKVILKKLFIEEHMIAKGFTFESLGEEMGVSRTTVWRWANEQWRLDPIKMENLAKALGLSGAHEFYRRPTERVSLDLLMDGTPDEVFEDVLDVAKKLKKRIS